jgi:hypothetical protein
LLQIAFWSRDSIAEPTIKLVLIPLFSSPKLLYLSNKKTLATSHSRPRDVSSPMKYVLDVYLVLMGHYVRYDPRAEHVNIEI